MKALFAALLGSMLTAAALGDSDAARLRLRPQVTVSGPAITLADVLEFADGAATLASEVGDQPAFVTPPAGRRASISHEQIAQRLAGLGVNPADILLQGALACDITLAPPSADHQPTAHARRSEKSAAGARTLAALLQTLVNEELAELGGRAELQFDRAGREFLELTTPPWEFKVTASGSGPLGLREFRVVIRRDGRTQRTVQVFAHVRLTRPVVVARRPLSIGNFIRHDDVTLETRVFDDGDGLGLAAVEQAVGQQVKRFVPEGEMVSAGAVQAVDLVRRTRPVTILGASENVQVRLTGVALDSGSFGDTVRVRIGDSRRDRQQLRGVVTGLGTVRILEDQP